MRSPDVRVSARRVAIARSLLLILFGVLCARAAHLAVDERGARRGLVQTVNAVTLPAQRGAVFDRDGTPLALTIDAPSVYAVAGELRDVPATARKLAGALRLDAAALEQRLRKARSFVFVARWVEREAAERVRALTLPGVGLLEEPRRVYPHKELAAQVIGFANIDGVGVRAIEQQEDAWLRGEARRVGVERDARGGLLVSGGLEGWSTAGGDVRLTLDMALQAEAAAALRDAIAATGARGGVVLSLDPFSGDVLALAEAPAFDPNRFRTLDFARTRAHAFLDAQEPGSTLKAFLVAAALEKGAIRADQLFDCEDGTLRVPGKTIRDMHPHAAMRPADIVRVSSNIGAVKIAWALGRDPYFDMLRRFGFGERTGSGFPDESAGMLRAASRWRAGRPRHRRLRTGPLRDADPARRRDRRARERRHAGRAAPGRRAPPAARRLAARGGETRRAGDLARDGAQRARECWRAWSGRREPAGAPRCRGCASPARRARPRSSIPASASTPPTASRPGSSAWCPRRLPGW